MNVMHVAFVPCLSFVSNLLFCWNAFIRIRLEYKYIFYYKLNYIFSATIYLYTINSFQRIELQLNEKLNNFINYGMYALCKSRKLEKPKIA